MTPLDLPGQASRGPAALRSDPVGGRANRPAATSVGLDASEFGPMVDGATPGKTPGAPPTPMARASQWPGDLATGEPEADAIGPAPESAAEAADMAEITDTAEATDAAPEPQGAKPEPTAAPDSSPAPAATAAAQRSPLAAEEPAVSFFDAEVKRRESHSSNRTAKVIQAGTDEILRVPESSTLAKATAADGQPKPAMPGHEGAEEVTPAARRDRGPGDDISVPRGEPTAASTAPQVPVVAAPRPTPVVPMAVEPGLSAAASATPEWRLTAEAQLSAPVGTEAARQVPVAPQAVVGQVAVAVSTTRERQVELRLDPPELGRVQIQLDTSDGGLRAVILAERPETYDLLRRHAEILQRELAEAGFDDVDLGFAAGEQEAGREGDPEPGATASFAVAAARTEAAPAAVGADLGADGALDIRL